MTISPSSSPAISVRNLSKQYRIGATVEKYGTLRDSLANAVKPPLRALRRARQGGPGHLHIWALEDVSFEVPRGQVLGVIGRNGAGKSTLLKVLSRVTEPTEGEVEIQGRVGSLLEVGTGFHPELTGRENIYLNGAILGMQRTEITGKFDEIVGFSGVDQFIDTPVKRYSSGMYLRLAFSVAAHLEPEILVVDEVLAVGDAEFQRKCLGKMDDVANQGRTVIFVSHNMSAILQLTQEAIWLDQGRVKERGPATQVVDRYLSSGFSQSGEHFWAPEAVPADAAPFSPIAIRVQNPSGKVVDTVRSTEATTIELEYRLDEAIKGLRVGIYLQTMRGELIFTTFDTDEPELYEHYGERAAGTYVSRCTIPADTLNDGRYLIGVNASSFRVKRYFQDERALAFNVDPTGAPGMHWAEKRLGMLRPRLGWEVRRG